MKYKDKLFRLIACLLAAHFMVMLGKEISTVRALTIWTYYPTLLINYVICLAVAAAVRYITIRLDKKYDWHDNIGRRALLQLIFGVGAVSILAFLLVWIYFLVFAQDIHASGYLDYEFPFAVTLIAALNLYYVTCYFYYEARAARRNKQEDIPVDELEPPVIEPERMDQYFAPSVVQQYDEPAVAVQESDIDQLSEEPPLENKKAGREILIVNTPQRSIPVKVREVVMLFIYERIVYMQPFGVTDLNDCYQFSGSLAEIEKELDQRDFFRLNRWCVINFEVIASFENAGDKGLIVNLHPQWRIERGINDKFKTKIYYINSERIAEFKAWMSR